MSTDINGGKTTEIKHALWGVALWGGTSRTLKIQDYFIGIA